MKNYISKLKINKFKKNKKDKVIQEEKFWKVKNIFFFFLSFLFGFLGIFLLTKKSLPLKIEKKYKNISYTSKIKEFINYALNLYYDPLDLINYLKKPNEKLLLVDVRDKKSFEKEHIKTAVFFENINQIKKLSNNGKKEIVLYGNYQGEKKVFQIAFNLLNQGLQVKILTIGYNQFRHLRMFWLPQSQWDEVKIDDFIEATSE